VKKVKKKKKIKKLDSNPLEEIFVPDEKRVGTKQLKEKILMKFTNFFQSKKDSKFFIDTFGKLVYDAL